MKYKHEVIATVVRHMTYEFKIEAFTNDPDGTRDEIDDQVLEALRRKEDRDPSTVQIIDADEYVEDIQITQTWVQGGVD
tara:strand:- start:253 stop:489 length:237 start_codon:yes stop_codon:yes gene_type:complete